MSKIWLIVDGVPSAKYTGILEEQGTFYFIYQGSKAGKATGVYKINDDEDLYYYIVDGQNTGLFTGLHRLSTDSYRYHSFEDGVVSTNRLNGTFRLSSGDNKYHAFVDGVNKSLASGVFPSFSDNGLYYRFSQGERLELITGVTRSDVDSRYYNFNSGQLGDLLDGIFQLPEDANKYHLFMAGRDEGKVNNVASLPDGKIYSFYYGEIETLYSGVILLGALYQLVISGEIRNPANGVYRAYKTRDYRTYTQGAQGELATGVYKDLADSNKYHRFVAGVNKGKATGVWTIQDEETLEILSYVLRSGVILEIADGLHLDSATRLYRYFNAGVKGDFAATLAKLPSDLDRYHHFEAGKDLGRLNGAYPLLDDEGRYHIFEAGQSMGLASGIYQEFGTSTYYHVLDGALISKVSGTHELPSDLGNYHIFDAGENLGRAYHANLLVSDGLYHRFRNGKILGTASGTISLGLSGVYYNFNAGILGDLARGVYPLLEDNNRYHLLREGIDAGLATGAAKLATDNDLYHVFKDGALVIDPAYQTSRAHGVAQLTIEGLYAIFQAGQFISIASGAYSLKGTVEPNVEILKFVDGHLIGTATGAAKADSDNLYYVLQNGYLNTTAPVSTLALDATTAPVLNDSDYSRALWYYFNSGVKGSLVSRVDMNPLDNLYHRFEQGISMEIVTGVCELPEKATQTTGTYYTFLNGKLLKLASGADVLPSDKLYHLFLKGFDTGLASGVFVDALNTYSGTQTELYYVFDQGERQNLADGILNLYADKLYHLFSAGKNLGNASGAYAVPEDNFIYHNISDGVLSTEKASGLLKDAITGIKHIYINGQLDQISDGAIEQSPGNYVVVVDGTVTGTATGLYPLVSGDKLWYKFTDGAKASQPFTGIGVIPIEMEGIPNVFVRFLNGELYYESGWNPNATGAFKSSEFAIPPSTSPDDYYTLVNGKLFYRIVSGSGFSIVTSALSHGAVKNPADNLYYIFSNGVKGTQAHTGNTIDSCNVFIIYSEDMYYVFNNGTISNPADGIYRTIDINYRDSDSVRYYLFSKGRPQTTNTGFYRTGNITAGDYLFPTVNGPTTLFGVTAEFISGVPQPLEKKKLMRSSSDYDLYHLYDAGIDMGRHTGPGPIVKNFQDSKADWIIYTDGAPGAKIDRGIYASKLGVAYLNPLSPADYCHFYGGKPVAIPVNGLHDVLEIDGQIKKHKLVDGVSQGLVTGLIGDVVAEYKKTDNVEYTWKVTNRLKYALFSNGVCVDANPTGNYRFIYGYTPKNETPAAWAATTTAFYDGLYHFVKDGLPVNRLSGTHQIPYDDNNSNNWYRFWDGENRELADGVYQLASDNQFYVFSQGIKSTKATGIFLCYSAEEAAILEPGTPDPWRPSDWRSKNYRWFTKKYRYFEDGVYVSSKSPDKIRGPFVFQIASGELLLLSYGKPITFRSGKPIPELSGTVFQVFYDDFTYHFFSASPNAAGPAIDLGRANGAGLRPLLHFNDGDVFDTFYFPSNVYTFFIDGKSVPVELKKNIWPDFGANDGKYYVFTEKGIRLGLAHGIEYNSFSARYEYFKQGISKPIDPAAAYTYNQQAENLFKPLQIRASYQEVVTSTEHSAIDLMDKDLLQAYYKDALYPLEVYVYSRPRYPQAFPPSVDSLPYIEGKEPIPNSAAFLGKVYYGIISKADFMDLNELAQILIHAKLWRGGYIYSELYGKYNSFYLGYIPDSLFAVNSGYELMLVRRWGRPLLHDNFYAKAKTITVTRNLNHYLFDDYVQKYITSEHIPSQDSLVLGDNTINLKMGGSAYLFYNIQGVNLLQTTPATGISKYLDSAKYYYFVGGIPSIPVVNTNYTGFSVAKKLDDYDTYHLYVNSQDLGRVTGAYEAPYDNGLFHYYENGVDTGIASDAVYELYRNNYQYHYFLNGYPGAEISKISAAPGILGVIHKFGADQKKYHIFYNNTSLGRAEHSRQEIDNQEKTWTSPTHKIVSAEKNIPQKISLSTGTVFSCVPPRLSPQDFRLSHYEFCYPEYVRDAFGVGSWICYGKESSPKRVNVANQFNSFNHLKIQGPDLILNIPAYRFSFLEEKWDGGSSDIKEGSLFEAHFSSQYAGNCPPLLNVSVDLSKHPQYELSTGQLHESTSIKLSFIVTNVFNADGYMFVDVSSEYFTEFTYTKTFSIPPKLSGADSAGYNFWITKKANSLTGEVSTLSHKSNMVTATSEAMNPYRETPVDVVKVFGGEPDSGWDYVNWPKLFYAKIAQTHPSCAVLVTSSYSTKDTAPCAMCSGITLKENASYDSKAAKRNTPLSEPIAPVQKDLFTKGFYKFEDIYEASFKRLPRRVGLGEILWNTTNQKDATSITISTQGLSIFDADIDWDAWSNDETSRLYITNLSNLGYYRYQYQSWRITGSPIVTPGSHIQIPVQLLPDESFSEILPSQTNPQHETMVLFDNLHYTSRKNKTIYLHVTDSSVLPEFSETLVGKTLYIEGLGYGSLVASQEINVAITVDSTITTSVNPSDKLAEIYSSQNQKFTITSARYYGLTVPSHSLTGVGIEVTVAEELIKPIPVQNTGSGLPPEPLNTWLRYNILGWTIQLATTNTYLDGNVTNNADSESLIIHNNSLYTVNFIHEGVADTLIPATLRRLFGAAVHFSDSRVLRYCNFYWKLYAEQNPILYTGALTFAAPNQPLNPDHRLAYISAGNYKIGNIVGDNDISDAPSTNVYLSGYMIAKRPVSGIDWQTVKDATTYPSITLSSEPLSNGVSDSPVGYVSWNEAIKYCNKLSLIEGLTPCYTIPGIGNITCDFSANGYRLPTEAEWEVAARGGLYGRRFPWGDTVSKAQADYCASCTSPTVSYNLSADDSDTSTLWKIRTNGYELYGMSGNSEEWCWDLYDTYQGGTNPTGPNQSTSTIKYHVARGGTHIDPANTLRCAYRAKYIPYLLKSGATVQDQENYSRTEQYRTFRVVRNAPTITSHNLVNAGVDYGQLSYPAIPARGPAVKYIGNEVNMQAQLPDDVYPSKYTRATYVLLRDGTILKYTKINRSTDTISVIDGYTRIVRQNNGWSEEDNDWGEDPIQQTVLDGVLDYTPVFLPLHQKDPLIGDEYYTYLNGERKGLASGFVQVVHDNNKLYYFDKGVGTPFSGTYNNLTYSGGVVVP